MLHRAFFTSIFFATPPVHPAPAPAATAHAPMTAHLGPRTLQVASARVTFQQQATLLGTQTGVVAGTGTLTGYVCPSTGGNATGVSTTFISSGAFALAPTFLNCSAGYFHNGGTPQAWRASVKCSNSFDAALFPYDFSASTACMTDTVSPSNGAASATDPTCGGLGAFGTPCFCNTNTWSFLFSAGTATCLIWCVACRRAARETLARPPPPLCINGPPALTFLHAFGPHTPCSPAGNYCPAGSTLATQVLCPAGSYCLSGAGTPSSCGCPASCPAGSSADVAT